MAEEYTFDQKLEYLGIMASDNPPMQEYLRRTDIVDFIHFEYGKSALWRNVGEDTTYDKLIVLGRVVQSSGEESDEQTGEVHWIIPDWLTRHTLAALGCQFAVKHIDGVQGIESPNFVKDECGNSIKGLVRMEYVPGTRLDHAIRKYDELQNPDMVRKLFEGLEATLEEVHRWGGVMHRDVKSANLLYNPKEQRLCLIDWDNAATFQGDIDDRNKGKFPGTRGFTHWLGTRGRDFYGAGQALLRTVNPQIKPAEIYEGEEKFIREWTFRLARRHRGLGQLYNRLMNKPPEQDLTEVRSKDSSAYFLKIADKEDKGLVGIHDERTYINNPDLYVPRVSLVVRDGEETIIALPDPKP